MVNDLRRNFVLVCTTDLLYLLISLYLWFYQRLFSWAGAADSWCLYSVYSICAWFSHWSFEPFCPKGTTSVENAHLAQHRAMMQSANIQTHMYKQHFHTSRSICLTTSTGHYWLGKRRRKSISQRPKGLHLNRPTSHMGWLGLRAMKTRT